ncbi:hypothetical protein LINPERHAP2_LOCUS31765 [Linum perenne]
MLGSVSEWTCQRSSCQNTSCCIEFGAWNMKACMLYALNVASTATITSCVLLSWRLPNMMVSRHTQTLSSLKRLWLKSDRKCSKTLDPRCLLSRGQRGTQLLPVNWLFMSSHLQLSGQVLHHPHQEIRRAPVSR